MSTPIGDVLAYEYDRPFDQDRVFDHGGDKLLALE